MTEIEFKEKVIGKKLGETDDLIKETFSEEDRPLFCVRSKDSKDFSLLLFEICGFPNNWNDLIITSIEEEYVNTDLNTKKRCLTAVVDKNFSEVCK